MYLIRTLFRAIMRQYVFLLGCSGVWAGNIPITLVGSTQTQIVISYTATTAAACTVSATDNNNGPAVNDLDPAKFANANSDINRTSGNGFRWPTIVTNLKRTVFIGGHDEIKQGTDGKWYSTALQVNSPHTITVACNGGVDVGTIAASTANLPVGSTYPELPIPAPGSPMGGLPQPTIDWSVAGRTAKYIDPITGVVIQRITGATDNFDDTQPGLMGFATTILDLNGAWTNPNNFTTNQVAGTLASTSTPNAPLFAAFGSFNPPQHEDYTDLILTPYGNASAGTVISEWCLSTDSGQTCANFTPLDVTYGVSIAAYPPIPSAAPSASFSGWGGMSVAFGNYDLQNPQIAAVSASGSTVTMNTPAAPGFNLDRKPGSKFRLTGCLSGADSTLTVATVNSNFSITVQESGLALTTCTYNDLASGVRVVLKNSGTLNVSFKAQAYNTRPAQPGSNGSSWQCGTAKVTDIQTDCDGNTQSPPLSGYLCNLYPDGIYLVQDNGRMCLQSNGYHSPIHMLTMGQFTTANTYLGQAYPAIGGPIYTVTHIPNDYHEVQVGDLTHTALDNFTYTPFTTDPTSQILAAGGPVADALNTGMFTGNAAFGSPVVFDNGTGNTLLKYFAGWSDSLCMLAFVDSITNTLVSSVPLFGQYPITYSACHGAGQGVGGILFYSVQQANSRLSPMGFSTATPLQGPFISRPTKVRKNGVFVDWTLNVSSCTAASPIVCTSAANDLDNIVGVNATQGAFMTISGATGGWSGLNGPWYAHKIDNNTFSLYSDPQGAVASNGTAFGSFSGTVTASLAPPIYALTISGASNTGVTGLANSGFARITIDTTGGPARYFPSGTLPLRDGDPITLVPGGSGKQLNSTTQYYGKRSCTGCTALQFDVYTDAALTTGAPFSAFSATNNSWHIALAEACPDPATITLPGPMYTDTGFGTTGAGNQKIRCVTVRLNSEAESDWPAAGEHAAYPPPVGSAEAFNTVKSMLHQINVGDAFGDLSHFNNNHEILYVLKVDRTAGENQIDVTVERSYGDDPTYGWRGTTNGPTDTYSLQHSPGWSAWGENAIGQGLIDISKTPVVYTVAPTNGVHNDIVPGSVAGNVTQSSGYQLNVPDDTIDIPVSSYAAHAFTQSHNSMPFFSTSNSYSVSSRSESYPSKRIRYNQAPLSEQVWKGDWMAVNAAFGNGRNNGDSIGWTRALTKIRGTAYDAGNTTSIVYKIPVITDGTVNTKIAPVLMTDVPHTYFVDKSGPGSLITDSDAGKYCVAYSAGECRPASSAGDVFFSGQGFYDAGQCLANDATMGSPCAFGLWPGAGWAVQIRQAPIDRNASGVRRLTLGFWLPPNHYSFSNWITTPDARWGIFSNNPIGGRPRKGLYAEGMQWWALKVPSWPISDTGNRTTFVPIVKRYSGQPGDKIRISFGYGENGSPSSLYCTSRQEACWTSSNPTSANPFVFATESQQPEACDAGCVVSIPAIPGRILFYQVERSNGPNVLTSPVDAVAVP